MKLVAFFLAAALPFFGVACVDGKTPDCTTVASGCFPEDTGAPVVDSGSDASDAAPVEAAVEAASDAPVD
jgi:hypothetical protein